MIKDQKNKTRVLGISKTAFEWAINPYNGCSHGCKYCYGMATQHKNYDEWLKASPKKNLIELLKEDIRTLRRTDRLYKVRDIFLGAITDSYQPLEATLKQTNQVIQVLIANELPFTILTKSNLILRDIDLFKGYKWCRVGVTITSFDETLRKDLEPYTADYRKRVAVLVALKRYRISTYLSGEPIMPIESSNPTEIIATLKDFVDLYDFGLYTNKGHYDYTPSEYKKHYKDIPYYVDIMSKAIQYCKDNNINYSNSSHSRKFFRDNKLLFQPYPLIKPLMPKRQQCLTAYF